MFTDSLLLAMSDPSLKWGDIIYEHEISTVSLASSTSVYAEDDKAEAIMPCFEEEALENWTMPDIRNYSEISTHFPVSLIPIGTNLYRIVWDTMNLDIWRGIKPTNLDEYFNYEEYVEFRLLTTLKAHPRQYVVKEGINGCLFEIGIIPDGGRALDVLKRFPVSWDRNGSIHYIKIHRTNASKAGLSAEDVAFDLMGALAECVDCSVSSAPNRDYLMTVTMLNGEVTKPVTEVPRPVALKKALSVLQSSEVSWERDGAVHYIKLHRVKASNAKKTANEVKASLVASLMDCSDCTISAPKNSDYLLTVTMV
jgi:hypothetical protein